MRFKTQSNKAPLGVGAAFWMMPALCGVRSAQLGDAQDKSSIAWILRISLLLIPLLDRTSAGNDEGAGVDFRTEGEVKTRGGYEGDGVANKRDKVRMAYYRAKTMLTVPSGAQTHLPLLLLPQSLSGCSFFTAG